jgi:hypothetical protein
VDAQGAARWLDALEYTQTRQGVEVERHTFVQRAWQRAGLQPHRLDRYTRSTNPAFEAKAADVIGLYLDPPQHAAVFCLDEKTAIQALDRLDPVLPVGGEFPIVAAIVRCAIGRSCFCICW